MKKNITRLVIAALSCASLQAAAPSKTLGLGVPGRELLDKIVVRVNGRNILYSDINQPQIEKDGGKQSTEDAIDQELMFQKAAERKLLPSSLDIEKHLALWKDSHQLTHLSEKDFEERLRSEGLTSKQYRSQLARLLAIRNLRQTEVSERVVITTREVEEFCENNPKYSQDRYLFKTKILPLGQAANKNEAAKKLEKIDWIEDLGWIEKSELAEHMSFVADLKEGEGRIVQVPQGYQMILLEKKEKKHLLTLEERWVEIEKELQQQKLKMFEKEYVEELKKKASIVYL